jgi:Cu+-exporting ATPase
MSGLLRGLDHRLHAILELLLSAPAVFWSGRAIHRRAFSSVRLGVFGMDSLVSLGALAAWASGFFPLFIHGQPSFAGISSMVVLLNLTGNWLQALATDRSLRAAASLLASAPSSVRLRTQGGERVIHSTDLVKGDVFLAGPGERIATDGTVLEGESTIDESLITGESIPVYKKPGSSVTGATVNLDGALVVRAERVGQETFLASVAALLEEAQTRKPRVRGLADRVTAIFVPVVLGLSAIAFCLWWFAPDAMSGVSGFLGRLGLSPVSHAGRLSTAFLSALAVLVISCPCALGLAVPAAVFAAGGRSASMGILVRNPDAYQSFLESDVFVFDKTGTLTEGDLEVVETGTFGVSREEFLGICSAVEKKSLHPIAKALSGFSRPDTAEYVTEFRSVSGKGVEAVFRGKRVCFGSAGFLSDHGIVFEEPSDAVLRKRSGEVVVYGGWDGVLKGFVSLSDRVRPESAGVIKFLRESGKRSVMVTGDADGPARLVADRLGVDEVRSGVLPGGKVDIVKSFQTRGAKVAMAGDGVNDAAALKQADAGLALSSGTDIAREAADVILMSGGISKIPVFGSISRLAFGRMRQNLFWAFFYNIVAIPLAMTGVLHPLVAEIAMTFSSLAVVFNSMGIMKRNGVGRR